MTIRRKNTHEQGFTIVELIVATVLFALVIGLAATGFSSIQQVQRNERYYDTASTAAQRIIEEVRNGQYATYDIGSHDVTAKLPSGLPGAQATLRVSRGAILSEHKLLAVDVKFDVGTYQRHVYVNGIITPEGVTQ